MFNDRLFWHRHLRPILDCCRTAPNRSRSWPGDSVPASAHWPMRVRSPQHGHPPPIRTTPGACCHRDAINHLARSRRLLAPSARGTLPGRRVPVAWLNRGAAGAPWARSWTPAPKEGPFGSGKFHSRPQGSAQDSGHSREMNAMLNGIFGKPILAMSKPTIPMASKR